MDPEIANILLKQGSATTTESLYSEDEIDKWGNYILNSKWQSYYNSLRGKEITKIWKILYVICFENIFVINGKVPYKSYNLNVKN